MDTWINTSTDRPIYFVNNSLKLHWERHHLILEFYERRLSAKYIYI